MNLKKDNWNKKDYKEFINYLNSLKDKKYKNFHSKLILSDNLIGIKTPILRNIAKEISVGNYESFIKLNNHKFYEEKIIHGLIIGYIKKDFKTIINSFNSFIKYIDNWAICDICVSNMKIFSKNLETGKNEIEKYLKDSNFWINRVGIVLLLDFYINDDYIDYLIEKIKTIKSNEYYVNMALAWLISICYIKYKDKTIVLFKEKYLDKWVHNKAIQKIIESKRINIEEKNELKKLKIID